MKYLPLAFLVILTFGCKTVNLDLRTANFPTHREKVTNMPSNDKLWIFVMAGQSNMAGRGQVLPMDTLSNHRIINLDENNEWVYGKEPLHMNDPNYTALDGGMAFGTTLLSCVPDDVTIGILPCAVGGSRVAQWLNDDIHRGIPLLTNFKDKVDAATSDGVIKGIIWHQGESDSNDDDIPMYRKRTDKLFEEFRKEIGNESLPIIVGELATFMKPKKSQKQFDKINEIIHAGANDDMHRYVITTSDLTHKGDNLHFDAKSQKEMGKRFAKKYCEIGK